MKSYLEWRLLRSIVAYVERDCDLVSRYPYDFQSRDM